MTPALEVTDLEVRYGDTVAVDGVDVLVEPGEVVTLLGPSGCGKSTILRVIGGLIPPRRGVVRLDGTDVTHLPAHRRDVGLMFQDYALFPHRDVRGNVAFGLRMRGRARDDVTARVDEVLELVGLAGFGARSIASLSGGEQQRVALARALAPDPHVLMLDEPLGSLDRALRERLTVELREIFLRLGRSVVTVTHDQGEAFTLADRVVVMRDGRIKQVGRPVDVWRSPVDAFVASFLGYGNVFAVEVTRNEVATPWGRVPVPRTDGPASLVVRPDGVRFATDGDAGVDGTCGHATFRGDHFLVPVTLANGWCIEVVDRSGAAPDAGAPARVTIDRAACAVVDRGD